MFQETDSKKVDFNTFIYPKLFLKRNENQNENA